MPYSFDKKGKFIVMATTARERQQHARQRVIAGRMPGEDTYTLAPPRLTRRERVVVAAALRAYGDEIVSRSHSDANCTRQERLADLAAVIEPSILP